MNEAVAVALQRVLLDPQLWVIILASAVFGVFIGSVPGLTATMAVALLVPLTYWLDPISALAAIVTLEACAIFAGDIPAVLVRIPGTPASAAYTDIAHGLTLRGKADLALGINLTSSVVGGLFGAVVLILLGHQLARTAAWFSVAEYFWLYLLGLSCAVVVSHGPLLSSLFALLIGLLLSTVGLSAVHTQARFTFGIPDLYQGINFIPAMIGLFGVSEVLKNLLVLEPPGQVVSSPTAAEPVSKRVGAVQRLVVRPLHVMFLAPLALIARHKGSHLRSGVIGTLVGILPGAGADIASWVSLAVSRRSSRHLDQGPESEATLNALSDSTTANNAALAGAWIPALVFGIPGDSVTAIVLGVLLMKNIKPGPEIFEKQAVLVYSLYVVFLLANLVLIPVGLLACKVGTYCVRMPRRVLLPVILLSCVLGSHAINGSTFDIVIMLVMGVLGFVLERRQVPLGPIVLGIILGGPLEERFIQTLTGADGSPLAFVDRPLAAGLALIWLALWGSTIIWHIVRGRSASSQSVEPKAGA
jgi:TctA family transporter